MNYKNLLGAATAALLIIIAVFMLAPAAGAQSKFKTLYSFTGGTDGGYPYAGVIIDQAGNLYGTTYEGGDLSCYGNGCGTVFELTPNSKGGWKEKVLYSFSGGTDGLLPRAGLTFDQAGNLYGTTQSGGAYGGGTVFELTPNPDGSWTKETLHSFTGTDGRGPVAGLIFDQAGNLYGTTGQGGNPNDCVNDSGCGVVFKLTPNADGSWTEKTLYSFTGGSKDDGDPWASLVFDQAGNLYGTTEGVTGNGTVFELTPNADGTWKEKTLHHFTGGDGRNPVGSLIFDQAGNLYSTAWAGGDGNYSGCGVVFELVPNANGSWKEKMLHYFNCGWNGGAPLAGLIFDQAGNLYGTTYIGGVPGTCDYGCGVVFELTPNADGKWNEKALHRFMDHRDGYCPVAGVILDAAGNLYGTTNGDFCGWGVGFGSVFEITP